MTEMHSTEQIWKKCSKCEQIIYEKELKENLWICPKCKSPFRLAVKERLKMLVDDKSFEEMATNIASLDPLGFPGYSEKLKKQTSKNRDAIAVGTASIGGHKVVLAIMEFDFMGGSMGSVVGEKITNAIERAIKERKPLIIISSSGGARMQEGILSLMQMAKTSAALSRLDVERIPYISILTDPTTGGVSASYAMLGDINLAEEGALIGFAGPRVIEETIKQKLPDGFQRSRFLLEHGIVDIVAERKELKNTIKRLLDVLLKNRK